METAGGRIDLRHAGQGRNLLFVHGLMVDGHLWDPLAPGLHDRFHIVLPDMPLGGHRTPLEPDADCSLETHARSPSRSVHAPSCRSTSRTGSSDRKSVV